MAKSEVEILDRKLFFIQSKLLEDDNNQSGKTFLLEAQQWFQPRHYIEIIEERSNEGRCGYPLCCNPITRPSNISAILKISYKEKRLYELGRSKLFCCGTCLQLSAVYEASLLETHPASRQVAIDFLLRSKENLQDTSDTTVSSDYFNESNSSRVGDISNCVVKNLPQAHRLSTPNSQLAVANIAQGTTVTRNSLLSHNSEIRSLKSGNVRSISNKLKETDIQKKSLQEPQQELLNIVERTPVAVQPMGIHSSLENSSFSSLISCSSSLPTLNYGLKTDPKSELKAKEKEKEKKKKVVFSLASLESSVEEKWVDNSALVPSKHCTSNLTNVPSVRGTNIGAKMEKVDKCLGTRPVTDIQVINSSAAEITEQNHSIISIKESSTEDMLRKREESGAKTTAAGNLTVAETAMSERTIPINFNVGEITVRNNGNGRNKDDNDSDSDIYSGDYEENLSLFMLLWTTLDDLFGECQPIITSIYPIANTDCEVLILPESCNLKEINNVKNESDNKKEEMIYITGITVRAKDDINDDIGRNEDERERGEDGEELPIIRESIDTTLLASQRSVAMFLQRGFLTAEKSLDVFSYISLEGLVRYRAVKDLVLISANLQDCVCPRLKSSEFTIVAVLLIDAIIISQNLLINTEMVNWESNLKESTGKILRIRAGRTASKDSVRVLRVGDLELLRNFFPRKML